jgi:hypothetical protein
MRNSSRSVTALPAQPETIAEFVDSVCQGGASSASIRRKLVAIASIPFALEQLRIS